MSIKSLFITGSTGEVMIERHWRGTTARSVCDFFWDEVTKYESRADVPPIMCTASYYLVSVYRDDVFLIAALTKEVAPLLIIEFLHRVGETFADYFGGRCDEAAIKDHFSTVYQLLEEMVDNGTPLTTEPNALKAMIAPPSVMGRLQTIATGRSAVSDVLPDGTISSMPWRKAGVKYAQNDIYLDIVEEVDAIVDKAGQVVSSEVTGSITGNCRLSGVPDLALSFTDPDVIDDCSFHPCVRYTRFERDKVVSFVPPDGVFELMRYRVNAATNVLPPLAVTPQIALRDVVHGGLHGPDAGEADHGASGGGGAPGRGRVAVQVAPKATSSLVLPGGTKQFQIEDVALEIPFPKCVKTATLAANVGAVLYDEATKVARWTIGKLDSRGAKQTPQLQGTLVIQGNANDADLPTIRLEWKVPAASVSGIGIAALQLTNEKYRPYKGVRTVTKSGRFQIRA
mmetsp:Transcript_8507/g.34989  ORF Transcript_8507/g.34989 Transcript_8507/m.34989 type:complete len:455 (+) Transcript_8507:111-1475(+)|eukprot:CAMPEP_0185703278 /NCGR_PEP_ID=MMETSP1164-20130828/14204_1 /TAXON_ID=1104430 /ORGANISM="Chrysoreinhardia sp, Strain CCMP2950" /LENGTH=454 /DNA_ID=CAMNT_0028370561 /DNA_START=87 /DNA_END=1451 /DNA_ORIENTATION=-